jgi:hypothetical protein
MTDQVDTQILSDNEINRHNMEDYLSDDFREEKKVVGFFDRYFAPLKSGSLRGSIISLASMCMGTASLSFPVALSNLGLIPGTFLYFLLTFISYWSLSNLLEAGRKKKIMNFAKLIKECLGDKMLLLLDINNLIFGFGVLMTYQFSASIFFMELMDSLEIAKVDDSTVKLIQMGLCMLLFQIPLSLLKNMSKLQYANLVGSFALIYTVFVIFIESFFYYQEAIEAGRSITFFKLDWSFLDSFSIFLYGYASHNGIFTIYAELNQPTLRRSKKVLNRAIIFLFFLFSMIAFSGFFSLIEKTPSIFISRPALSFFNGKDYFIMVSKFLFILSLQCFCATNYNVLRTPIRSFFFKGENIPFKWDFFITIFVFILSNSLTYFIDNVIKIIGILGGLCAVIVCYLCPILCYVNPAY